MTDKEYLKEIKKDITFYKKFNLRADYSIDIDSISPKVLVNKITELLIEEEKILMESMKIEQNITTDTV